MNSRWTAARVAILLAAVAGAAPALAQTAPSLPPPYSLPWLLRSMAPASVVRVDETLAWSEDPASGARSTAAVTSLTATWKASPRWVPVFRQTWVRNSTPSSSGSAFSNPLLGVSYIRPLHRGWRMSTFLATTVPVGSGGGGHPQPSAAAAIAAAVPARSAMDNALFAVNYWTLIGGLGLARVTRGATLQAEATVLQLDRVRGPATQDAHRTNLTAGLHAGRFFTRRLSLGAELRMQRWMTNAAPVRGDPRAREQFTFGIGPRVHLSLGKRWLRPGLSYSRALDAPMRARGYEVLQLDVPFVF